MTAIPTDDETTAVLRPLTFDSFKGQDAARDRLQVHIDAAKAEDRAMDHTLLVGPPGMGKTTLAGVIASQLGDPLHVIRRPPPAKRLASLLLEIGGGIVFIDELHLWSKAGLQSQLLPLLDEERILETEYGPYHFPHLTIIGATTERDQLLGPLYDRFMVKPPLLPYDVDTLADIVAGMGVRLGMRLADEVCEDLARAAGGVPRAAKELVLAAKNLLTSRGVAPTSQDILDFIDITPEGLTRDHRDYLAALIKLGGQAGVARIAMLMRAPEATVQLLERLLIEQDLIGYGAAGRTITPLGRMRMGAGVDPRFVPRSARVVA